MTKQELITQIKQKRSFLCVGLDPDLNKIPEHLLRTDDPVFEFNKQIIDATKDFCVAYKPNIAFYECLGKKGWDALEKTVNYIPKNILTIADAKRGDIGNTSQMYAKTFFETYQFDAITVAPYMGKDSVQPFLNFENKWTVLLALTSNEGSKDFQTFSNGKKELFEEVITTSQQWENAQNLMYVIGATRGGDIARARQLAPKNFFLVPGVGAQGGSLEDVCKYGMNDEIGLLINSSRSIIYADNSENFSDAAREAAKQLREEMSVYLK